MALYITRNASNADLLTHSGKFHADEVMATAILHTYFAGKKLSIARLDDMSHIPKRPKRNAIIYDIGHGKYDHHQPGGNGIRENGIPYSSSGLVWRDFGHKILSRRTSQPHYVWLYVEKNLIQGIDAIDNHIILPSEFKFKIMSVSHVISSFNPTWDSEESYNNAFLTAVGFAETILENVINKGCSKIKASQIMQEILQNVSGKILVLEKYVPWEQYVLASEKDAVKELLFVIYPSNRGGYLWRCIPKSFSSDMPRKSVPEIWNGLEGKHLQAVCGIKTAVFCHSSGFIGGTETLEDCVRMVEKAIND